jgi:GH24 family phage-related lysozyme (muramidase)
MGGYAIPGPVGGHGWPASMDQRHGRRDAEVAQRGARRGGTRNETGGHAAAVEADALDYDAIYEELVPFEGKVEYMYLDSVGLVTVGVGNMLPTAVAAIQLPFVNASTKQPASANEIAQAYDAVARSAQNQKYSKYKQNPSMELRDETIKELAIKRLRDEFVPGLQTLFGDFDTFPVIVRSALIDMAYNLGLKKLGGDFKRFCESVRAWDWAKAALACHRRGVQEKRNEWAKNAFERAAEQ